MSNFIKAHLFSIVVVSLLIIFVPVFIYLLFGIKNKPSKAPTINPNPAPITSGFGQSYSNFDQLIPGKSTLSDVEKINGPAYRDSIVGDKIYLYYKTPLSDYENKILLKNGILYYSQENVFGNYRGTYSNYVSTYGQPMLHLFNKDSAVFEWFIFLKQGFSLEVGSNDILQIVHFVPQSKDEFMKNIAPELNLISAPPVGPNEYPAGVNPAP